MRWLPGGRLGTYRGLFRLLVRLIHQLMTYPTQMIPPAHAPSIHGLMDVVSARIIESRIGAAGHQVSRGELRTVRPTCLMQP